MVGHLIEACPNIESLFVGLKDYGIEEMPTNVDFLSAIRFKNLRSFSRGSSFRYVSEVTDVTPCSLVS